MVKFNKNYRAFLLEEAGSSYVDYDRLKKVIYQLDSDTPINAEYRELHSYLDQCFISMNSLVNRNKLNVIKTDDEISVSEITADTSIQYESNIPEVEVEAQSILPSANESRKLEFLKVFNEESMKSQKLLEVLIHLLKKHFDLLESYISSLSANPFKTKNSSQYIELFKMPLDADKENELTHSALLFGIHFQTRGRSDSEEVHRRRQLKGSYFRKEDTNSLLPKTVSTARMLNSKGTPKHLKIRELSLKRHITDMHNTVVKLREFQLLNYTASIKILKKYDKVLAPLKSEPIFSEQFKLLQISAATIGSELSSLSEDLVNIYANCFCKSNIEEALGKLKFSKGTDTLGRFLLLRIGIKYGVALTLLIWILSILNSYDGFSLVSLDNPDSYCFLLVGNFLVFRFLWIINVLFFEHYKVNYIVLLEITESHVPKWAALFDENGTYWLGYFLFVIFWVYAEVGVLAVPPATFSMGILFATIGIIAYAFYKDREYGVLTNKRFLYVTLWTTPSYHVEFRDVIATDWFTSFNRILGNLVYACFYLFSGCWLYSAEVARDMFTKHARTLQILSAVVFIFPLSLRALQVLRVIYDAELPAIAGWKQYFHNPQSINLFKYVTSIVTVIVGTLVSMRKGVESQDTTSVWFYIPILFYSLATVYQVYWDTVVDFGFLNSRQNYLLRDKLLYHDFKQFYYAVLFMNPLLRLMWCFSLLPENLYRNTNGYGYGFIALPFVELIRRSLWCIIRVEHEHVKAGEQLCNFLKPTLSYDMSDVIPLHFDCPNLKIIDVTNLELIRRRNIAVALHAIVAVILIILPFVFIV